MTSSPMIVKADNKEAGFDGKLFCPNCGTRGVWFVLSDEDYYEGMPHICTNCKSEWYMPSGPEDVCEERHRLLKAIKEVER